MLSNRNAEIIKMVLWWMNGGGKTRNRDPIVAVAPAPHSTSNTTWPMTNLANTWVKSGSINTPPPPSSRSIMFIVVMLMMMMMMVAIMAVGDDGTRLLTSNWSRCRAHHSSRKVASFVVGVILFSLITMLVLLFDSLTSKKPRFHSITVKKKKKHRSLGVD